MRKRFNEETKKTANVEVTENRNRRLKQKGGNTDDTRKPERVDQNKGKLTQKPKEADPGRYQRPGTRRRMTIRRNATLRRGTDWESHSSGNVTVAMTRTCDSL